MSTSVDALTGALWLRPGVPAPHNLRSTRPLLASRVAAGQSAHALPGLLAGLFSLCGHAHRLCSRLAIEAAAPGLLGGPADALAEELRRETAGEHARRIGMDWPRLLAPAHAEQALQTLCACPLLHTPALAPVDWPAVRAWLQTQWLGMDCAAWLQAWPEGFNDWSRRAHGWLPALLRHAQADDIALPLNDIPALKIAASPDALQELGRVLVAQPGFAAAPRWRGRCAHTGTWSRLRAASPRPDSAHALLGSRIAELARLCLPDGAAWLQWGSLPTGPNQGLAWVEMARGLLVHQVTLNPQSPRVQACQVLAPTEWNFHPEGVAAQALAALPAHAQAQVRLLMAALDPCVPFQIEADHA